MYIMIDLVDIMTIIGILSKFNANEVAGHHTNRKESFYVEYGSIVDEHESCLRNAASIAGASSNDLRVIIVD